MNVGAVPDEAGLSDIVEETDGLDDTFAELKKAVTGLDEVVTRFATIVKGSKQFANINLDFGTGTAITDANELIATNRKLSVDANAKLSDIIDAKATPADDFSVGDDNTPVSATPAQAPNAPDATTNATADDVTPTAQAPADIAPTSSDPNLDKRVSKIEGALASQISDMRSADVIAKAQATDDKLRMARQALDNTDMDESAKEEVLALIGANEALDEKTIKANALKQEALGEAYLETLIGKQAMKEFEEHLANESLAEFADELFEGDQAKAMEAVMEKAGKNLLASRLMKKVSEKISVPASKTSKGFSALAWTILNNAFAMDKASAKMALMLVGDAGTGKTSQVRKFARLVGCTLIVIEAPHISAEQVIRIPFVVSVSKGRNANIRDEATIYVDETTTAVERAESSLVTKLKKTEQISNGAWGNLLKMDGELTKAMQDPHLASTIVAFRKLYDRILFVDEFFRVQNKNVANILRGLLNGKIGQDRLPLRTYFMFASNVDNTDGSLNIAGHIRTQDVKADEVDSNALKEYMMTKFFDTRSRLEEALRTDPTSLDNDEMTELAGPPMRQEALNCVMDVLLKSDAKGKSPFARSQDDSRSRLSPRRTEEMVKAINGYMSLMDKGGDKEQIAQYILQKIHQNMTTMNADSGEFSKHFLYDDMMDSVRAMLASKGVNNPTLPSAFEWDKGIKAELALANALGNSRKYPLLVSGATGIGKTFTINKTAREEKMGFLSIECHTLSKDDAIGITLPSRVSMTDASGVTRTIMQANQTEAPLYRYIAEEYEHQKAQGANSLAKYAETGDADYLEGGSKFVGFIPHPDRKYNFILFLDEFSRVEDKSIYNQLRRLILEREFADGKKLAGDIMIMGAMNPTDAQGATEGLTDHMIDVVDIMDSQPSVKGFKNALVAELMNEWDKSAFNDAIGNDNKEKYCQAFAEVWLVLAKHMSHRSATGRQSDIAEGAVEGVSDLFYWFPTDDSILSLYVEPRHQISIAKNFLSAVNTKQVVSDINGEVTLDGVGDGGISLSTSSIMAGMFSMFGADVGREIASNADVNGGNIIERLGGKTTIEEITNWFAFVVKPLGTLKDGILDSILAHLSNLVLVTGGQSFGPDAPDLFRMRASEFFAPTQLVADDDLTNAMIGFRSSEVIGENGDTSLVDPIAYLQIGGMQMMLDSAIEWFKPVSAPWDDLAKLWKVGISDTLEAQTSVNGMPITTEMVLALSAEVSEDVGPFGFVMWFAKALAELRIKMNELDLDSQTIGVVNDGLSSLEGVITSDKNKAIIGIYQGNKGAVIDFMTSGIHDDLAKLSQAFK